MASCLNRSQSINGFTLLALIGILAAMSILAAVLLPNSISRLFQHALDTEQEHLERIAKGIKVYLNQNLAFPPTLASLNPDYVPYPTAQLTDNERGYDRYYYVHPTMDSFSNPAGLASSDVKDARFLLISNLTQDEAPTITNASEFETWWTTDASATPGLHIYRDNVGWLFYQLTIDQDGNGGSYQLNGTATNSGGGPLTTHTKHHLIGTPIKFDEANTYATPEVQFALTTNTAYWFDPNCTAGKQWNPLDPDCVSGGDVYDQFTTVAYNGNDGSENWSNSWQELGESDGTSSGRVRVRSSGKCASGNCLRIGGNEVSISGRGLTREADLSAATTATLTFSYRRKVPEGSASVTLAVSDDGGTGWTNLQTYNLNVSDGSPIPQSFDITAYMASNTQIRFLGSGTTEWSQFIFVDNVRIQWCEGPC